MSSNRKDKKKAAKPAPGVDPFIREAIEAERALGDGRRRSLAFAPEDEYGRLVDADTLSDEDLAEAIEAERSVSRLDDTIRDIAGRQRRAAEQRRRHDSDVGFRLSGVLSRMVQGVLDVQGRLGRLERELERREQLRLEAEEAENATHGTETGEGGEQGVDESETGGAASDDTGESVGADPREDAGTEVDDGVEIEG